MTTAYTRRRPALASFDSIRVAATMHRGVITCRPEAPLSTVARLLAAHRIHAVVVAPEGGGDAWGIVSDLDLAAALSEGSDEATAGQIASGAQPLLHPDEPLTRALHLMREYETHHVIVLGRSSRRPVGIISTLDIAGVVADL
jgi:CBS domain-containing protein